ncbi:MAG TPA: M14 family metallopeptidase [Gemmatimonadales bacterium]|nr:M14 family metallopeptidase [Gemmatimonadales bacterium]
MALLHVAISGRDERHLTALGPKLRIVVVSYKETKRGITVDAYVRSEKVEWLKKQGYGVVPLENVEPHDRKRQAEEHAAAKRRLEKGRYGDVIWSGGYLTADEVEGAIALGARNHAGYFEPIPLPHLTWENRRVHGVRIGKGNGKNRPAVCFIGGVHGREWGGPDILVYFAVRLLRAYRDNQGFRLGKRVVSPARVRRLVETMDIVLLPQVNPDGRRFSMDRHPFWRKNRRPAPRGKDHRSIGVDLNRNFPFLWRYDRHFAPKTVQSSHKPGDYETYVGPRAASEPETRNVIWLLDRFPNIRYYVDLHSYGETILYSWGSDDNQFRNPGMSFRNQTFDGKRGRIHDEGYREYIPTADQEEAIRTGRQMAAAIELVRGRKYQVKQSVGLYPTAGASDDYAYSRHFVDPRKGKVIAYTIEWGRSHASTPFHPPYAEMRKVMREVSAGLLAVCLRALAKHSSG